MKPLFCLLLVFLPVIGTAKFFKRSSCAERQQNYYFHVNDFQPGICDRYDKNNALIFAKLSNIVYENRKVIEQIFHDIDPNIKFEFYHDGPQSTEYLFVNLKGYLIICFRGSESLVHFTGRGSALKDWIGTDRIIHLFPLMAKHDKKRYADERIPMGQKGFRKRTYQLIKRGFFTRLNKFVSKNKIDQNKQVFITGHSLGAALCQFIIPPLEKWNPRIQIGAVYLFAPPLSVQCKEAGIIQKKYGSRVHNIIYERDFVVRGQLRDKAAAIGYYYRSVADTINRTNKQYIHYSRDVYNTILGDGYHHLESYIKAIEKSCNASEFVNVYRPYPIGEDKDKNYFYPGDDCIVYKALTHADPSCADVDDNRYDPPRTTYRQRFINSDEEIPICKKEKKKKIAPNKKPD